ncbi:hypothetical protein L1987_24184 [Smallanthus sonchifolius]|uniref:Uncharacterized protein n=1 Tax=Smallanthus sonchifolius TaxID=185202 RepID=A0ACB9ILH4_9ASTR|nr:hypothetical protein L1987_24184 [Smallanthus sonchifolius]
MEGYILIITKGSRRTQGIARGTRRQRYEVKKYVLDRLVPLEMVLSRWPIVQLEYFRGLCSLYNFGEGFLAVSSDNFLGAGKNRNNSQIQNEDVEEVESKTGGTAEFMKEDLHYTPSQKINGNVLETNEPHL